MSGRAYTDALAAVDWIEEDESRAYIANAGLISYEGGQWLAKTDGKVALAVRLAEGHEAHGAPHPIAGQVAGLLDAPLGSYAWQTTVEAMREAVGEPAPHIICDACNGMGGAECSRCDGDGAIACECSCGDEHQRDCPDCDGTGSEQCKACGDRRREYPADPPISPVFIRTMQMTACFNRRLLSPLLVHISGPFTWTQGSEFSVARLRGEDWIAIVMPMRNAIAEPTESDVVRLDDLATALHHTHS